MDVILKDNGTPHNHCCKTAVDVEAESLSRVIIQLELSLCQVANGFMG